MKQFFSSVNTLFLLALDSPFHQEVQCLIKSMVQDLRKHPNCIAVLSIFRSSKWQIMPPSHPIIPQLLKLWVLLLSMDTQDADKHGNFVVAQR